MRRGIGVLCAALIALPLWAGGPLLVGGPTSDIDGKGFAWSTTTPVKYRLDKGNLGSILEANAPARIASMFDVWQQVDSASITFELDTALIIGAGADGNVTNATEFNTVLQETCDKGTPQNPIIFDTDGSIFSALGLDPNIIGFAGPCRLTSQGHIVSGFAALNGDFASDSAFNGAIIHEFGHLIGLDHSQINVECASLTGCTAADRAGLPTMFPFLVSTDMATLSPDDIAAVSTLYPANNFPAQHGRITGNVLFSDGLAAAFGVNVIARRADNPRVVAVSMVSGAYFTTNPGQPFTADYLQCTPAPGNSCPESGFYGDNREGSPFGSRSPTRMGWFELIVPPGNYTVEVENVSAQFGGGSSVGPWSPPLYLSSAHEFWNQDESDADDPAAVTVITVSAGQTVTANIILNGTQPSFDSFEESEVAP